MSTSKPAEKDTNDAPAPAAKPKAAWERAEAYEYVGPGVIPGVPNRDLEPWEVARVPVELLREVAHSSFYRASTAKDLAAKQADTAKGSK